MTRALLIIDIQLDYFPGGAYPLVGPDAAATVAERVLRDFRERGEPVIHVQHIWDAPDAAFMVPGTPGVEIHPALRPRGDEVLIQKAAPNSFVDTSLAGELERQGIDAVVIVGMMSSMCVDATARAALDRGLAVTVLHDGCAAPDLEFNGTSIAGNVVHAAFMAALGDAGATVVAADALGAG